MSKLLFNTKFEFLLLKRRENILQITVILVVSMGFGNDPIYRGFMVVASMYPASRIVVIPINCEYTKMHLRDICKFSQFMHYC